MEGKSKDNWRTRFWQINVRHADRDNFDRLLKHDTRGVADEFSVIVREALGARGLAIDPQPAALDSVPECSSVITKNTEETSAQINP